MLFDFGNGPVESHKHPNGGGMVADTATVDESVFVYPAAQVYDNAKVYGSVKLFNCARVFGFAKLYDHAVLSIHAKVYQHARIFSHAVVSDHARIFGHATLHGGARVEGYAQISGKAVLTDSNYVTRDCTGPTIGITGLQWPVTCYDGKLQVGCECHTFDAWAAFCDNRIELMSTTALTFWKANKEYLLGLEKLFTS